ncbi:Uncharacterised protein [Mycobacterium tuberculosis]|nr:Uncharacterised protein [Mycobacterium tuberculosis]
MSLQAIINRSTAIVIGPKGERLFLLADETSAKALHQIVKQINADLHADNFGLNRNALANRALGISNEDLLDLI